LEILDAGASRAFAVADHQVAHIYVRDASPAFLKEVLAVVEGTDGVERVLGAEDKEQAGIAHEHAGDLIAVAKEDAWFTYSYWLDDAKAPDFARTVDIHRKPGYDPVELFVDPAIRLPMVKIGTKLLKKKLGFRMLMDLIPLDAGLVKGSHGRIPSDTSEFPILIAPKRVVNQPRIESTDVYGVIKRAVMG
jgi:hypothetical protein